ncbi:MAG: mechanosensitive ion channel family protein [Candidatus Diapherotrites archaeon]|uniref:Mechanosensitive ion channel family protein n=1 Tax=Candidatus Iainarchaeum sp. TaxID=3101447 RepID=A0A7K4BZA4_9ARCH|nr:mechanosensitive ion channel family protein [Candidatus Diapherotrites archaeon]
MLLEFLTSTYFDNSVLMWGYALGTVLLFIVFSRIVLFVAKKYLKKLTSKTKSDFDDLLVDLVEEPLAFFIILAGFFVGYQFLSFPQSVSDIFYNILRVLVMLDIIWFVLKFTDSFFERIIKPITSKTKTKLEDQLIPWIKKTVKIILGFIGIVIVLDNMGIDVFALLAGLGIGGIAFAFAAQKTIADAFGGVSILFSRPFVIGDTIRFANGAHTGKVEEIYLRHTKVRNLDKQLVIVPNSILAGEIITNITKTEKRKVMWTIGITYDSSVEKINLAKKIISNAIKNCELCDSDYTVAFQDFGQTSLNILVIFYTKQATFKAMAAARDIIGLEIKKEFDKNKIKFALTTQRIQLKQ